MEHEQQCVEPLLGGSAPLGVNPFVLGHEQAGNAGEYCVNGQVFRVWREAQRQRIATEHAQGIDGVPDAFPTWQAAQAMKV
jgi:hypothetical protein